MDLMLQLDKLKNRICKFALINDNEFFFGEHRKFVIARYTAIYIMKVDRHIKSYEIQTYMKCSRMMISRAIKFISFQKDKYADVYYLYHNVKD